MSAPCLHTDVLCEQARKIGDRTHRAIALRAGVEQSTITRLLTGRTTPTAATLVALRQAYGVSLDDLLPTNADAVVPAA